MRNPSAQAKLDAMTKKEKYDATSYLAMYNRGVVTNKKIIYHEYKRKTIVGMRITYNEFPYEEYAGRKVIEHKIIWFLDTYCEKKLFHKILAYAYRFDYMVVKNSKNIRSVNRPHRHLLLLE